MSKKDRKVAGQKASAEAKDKVEVPGTPKPSPRGGRRRLLKAGLAGIALLPYVAPAVESILLSEAFAQAPLGPESLRRFRTRADNKGVSPIPKKKGFERRFRFRD